MRRLKLLATGVSIGLFLIIVGVGVLSFLYRHKLEGFLLAEINKRVETKVEIQKISFTILKKFPQASLELTDVLISPSKKYIFEKPYNFDTLLYAKKIYLQFNLIHLLKNKFILSKIHVDQGSINLQINKAGQYNFDILKKREAKGEAFSIDLNDVKCTRTNILFFNEAKNLRVFAESYNTRIKGNLSSVNSSISSISELYIHSIQSDNINLLKNTPADVTLDLMVENSKVTIPKGEIKFKGQFFSINGEIDARKTVMLDLNLQGTKLNLDDLMASFPDTLRKKLDLDLTGELFFKARVKGPWSITKYPHVSSEFGIRRGELTRNGISVSNVNFEGKFNNGKNNSLESSFLSLNPVSFNIEKDAVKGEIKIHNLKMPKALIQFSAALDLKKINHFLKISDLSDEEGLISGNLQAYIEVTDTNSLSKKNIYISQIQGSVDLKDIGFRWKDSKKRFNNITGHVDVDQLLTLKNLSIKVANNDLMMNVAINNFFEYLNHKDTLYISGNLKSEYLNFDEISSAFAIDKKGGAFALPDSMVMDLNITAGSLKWNNFTCHSLQTRVIYQPRTFLFQSVNISMLGGIVKGNAALEIKNTGDIGINVVADLKQIDISKMFESFNNFGQTVLQDKHLKGAVDGSISLNSLWNNQFEMYKEKIQCEAEIEIKNGELIDFAPLLALSKFIDVSELKHVRFATLKNSIYIRDNVVHIPSMDIASNALDISLSGTHNFSNEYDYHVTLSLADILWKKSNKKDQFGEVEQDKGRMKTHLLIKGKGNDYAMAFDRKKAREEFANHLGQEKQTVRTILHDELGWFKKDTARKVIPDVVKKVNVSWEEAENNLLKNSGKDSVKKPTPLIYKKPKVQWQDE